MYTPLPTGTCKPVRLLAICFQDDTVPSAISARQSGIHIILVSPEGDVDSLVFRNVVSYPPSANFFVVESFSDLPSTVSQTIDAMCDGKILEENIPQKLVGIKKCISFFTIQDIKLPIQSSG